MTSLNQFVQGFPQSSFVDYRFVFFLENSQTLSHSLNCISYNVFVDNGAHNLNQNRKLTNVLVGDIRLETLLERTQNPQGQRKPRGVGGE